MKEKLYSVRDSKIARYAKALSHPARITILRNLASGSNLTFSEISDFLPLARSTVSQHLTELKNSELIISTVESANVSYSINAKAWKTARKYIRKFMNINR
jgi:ArsR family transcriptional regulator, arsenate/arsenite/antimonite-responsive transcriptional repressor